MNKKLKLVLIILGGLLVLGAAGAWYAIANVNPVQLAQLIASSAKTATGRDLKIAGPVKLSVFPRIAVSAEQLSLSNAPWASASDFMTLKRIELDIKLLPLLSKNIEIGSVELSGLELFLQKSSSGKTNWDLSAAAENSAAIPDATSSANSSSGGLISMKNVSVDDARIHYQDGDGSSSQFRVRHFALAESGDRTSVALSMKYGDLAVEVNGKTGSISQALKDWDISPSKFPLDLTIGIAGKSMLVRGELIKDPKALPVINLALTSKVFAWPSQGDAVSQNPQASGVDPTIKTKGRLAPKQQSQYLFSDESLPFNLLSQAKGKITVDILELDLPKRKPIQNLKASIQMNGDSIDVPQFTFQMDGGSADIQLNLSQLSSSAPILSSKGLTKNLTLENLLTRVDPSSKVSGGKMRLAFDVKAAGGSLHKLAANSTGKIQVSIDQAKMGSNALNDAGDFVVTLLDSMNPLRKKSKETTLECAVFYLPVNQGQVNIANTIGLETDRLNVVVAGSINLKTERVDLTIDPQEKSGLTTGLDLAGLVRMGGTLTQPKVVLNQAGVVTSAVSIGLGILTGGATILAENAKSIATKGRPCRAALHPWSDIYPGAE